MPSLECSSMDLLNCHFVIYEYNSNEMLLEQSGVLGSSKILRQLLHIESNLDQVISSSLGYMDIHTPSMASWGVLLLEEGVYSRSRGNHKVNLHPRWLLSQRGQDLWYERYHLTPVYSHSGHCYNGWYSRQQQVDSITVVAVMFLYIVTIAILKWIFVKQVVERWPRLNWCNIGLNGGLLRAWYEPSDSITFLGHWVTVRFEIKTMCHVGR